MTKNTKKLYRYEEVLYSLGVDQFGDSLPGYDMKVQLREYIIIKETPKGVWIDVYSDKKFVLLTARKKFACSTKEDALASFKYRKQRQIKILTAQLDRAKEALRIVESKNWIKK